MKFESKLQHLEKRSMIKNDIESRLLQRAENIAICEELENLFVQAGKQFQKYEKTFVDNINYRFSVIWL